MKKKLLMGVFVAIATSLAIVSPKLVSAASVDITADVSMANAPSEAVVGDSGKFSGKIEDVQGLKVTGTIKYQSLDPNILSVTENGEWKAKAPGKVTIVPKVTLSNETMQALKDKFSGETFVTRDVTRIITIMVIKKSSPVYRIYNPNSGEHFFTMDTHERDNLKKYGWYYEGIGWEAPHLGNPIYRIYNPNSGEHFYTMNTYERDNLKKHGWRYEGISWYSEMSGTPVYRLYNKNNAGPGAHHYTNNANERDSLKKIGWIYEGVSWNGK